MYVYQYKIMSLSYNTGFLDEKLYLSEIYCLVYPRFYCLTLSLKLLFNLLIEGYKFTVQNEDLTHYIVNYLVNLLTIDSLFLILYKLLKIKNLWS